MPPPVTLPGKTVPQLPAAVADDVTASSQFVVRPAASGQLSKLPASELIAALNAARVGQTTLGRWAQYWDGSSHKLNSLFGSDAAVVAQFPQLSGVPFNRATDEIAWAALQNAIDEAEDAAAASAGRPAVVMPPGIGYTNRPIRLRENTVLRGAGMRNTTFLTNRNSGAMLLALSRSCTDSSLIDSNGLVVGGSVCPIVDLSELSCFGTPASGDWWMEIEFFYTSGDGGYLWGFGGRPDRSQDRYIYANLAILAGGLVQAYGNWTDSGFGPQSGATSAAISTGNWHTIRVTLKTNNTGVLRVDGVDYNFNLPIVYPAVKWWDSLCLNTGLFSSSGLWPDNKYAPQSPPVVGRIRNVKFTGSGGVTADIPLTNIYDAHTTCTTPANELLLVRPINDMGGMDCIHLSDFRVQSAGHAIGMYVNNCQNSSFERLDFLNGHYGAQWHQNCYSIHVAGCRFHGSVCAFMAWNNAQMFSPVNCTFQGGFCPLAVFNSFGFSFTKTWVAGIQASSGAGIGLLLSNSAGVVTGLTSYDEGSESGFSCLVMLRDSHATIVGPNFSRAALSGTVVKIDRGGEYQFCGGIFQLEPNGGTAAFTVVSAPTYKVRIDGSSRSVTFGNTPPWSSAADAKYFDAQPAQPFPVSVANDGVLATGIAAGAGKCCEIQVVDGTNTRSARYGLDNTTFTQVYAHSQFTTTADTPAKVNTYVSSGFIVVQNKTGGPLLLAAYEK